MLAADGQTIKADLKWTQRPLGSQGWNTGGVVSRDGLYHKIWFDVTPPFARRLSVDEDYDALLKPGKVPDIAIGFRPPDFILPGNTSGGWHCGFGGADANVSYLTLDNGIYVSSNFLGARTYTRIFSGHDVDPNQQTTSRTFARKGYTDPINADVYCVGLNDGTYLTLDRGATAPAKVTWLPDPAPTASGYDPQNRWTIFALDEAGANTGGGSPRKARIGACPNGRGVHLSTDGFASGVRISNITLIADGAPAAGTGINGDYYINTANSQVYGPKAGGAWPAGTAIAGGATVLFGAKVPLPADGANGNYFVDTRTSLIYGPKAAGAWPAAANLVKPAGNPGFFSSVCSMEWVSGKLMCCVIEPHGQQYNAMVAEATGGSTIRDNVRVFDPSAGTWSILNHGGDANGRNMLGFVQFITLDPSGAGRYFLSTTGSEFLRWNGSTWTYTGLGNGTYHTNGVGIHSMARTVSTKRPAVADRYRNGGPCFALSDPIVVLDPVTGVADALLVAHTGLGPLATRLADWPTQNLLEGGADNPLDPAKAPLWREITATAEAKVGQVPLILGDKIWNGAQDISVSGVEMGERGHEAAVYTFPPGPLSDADDMARGHVSGFGIVLRHRSGATHTMGIAYTDDNKKWQLAPNQPPCSYPLAMNPYSPGCIACGANYSAAYLPGWCFGQLTPALVPYVWADIRSSVPQPITFKKENGTVIPVLFNQSGADGVNPASLSGFHAAFFSSPSKKVCIDPDNPSRFYFWNVGGTTDDHGDPNSATYSFTADPSDVGGIYMLDVNSAQPTTATRVYSAKAETGFGNPQRNGNFGIFDTAMLIANGYMVLASNALYTGGAATGNQIVVLNMTTWQRRVLNTGPYNFYTLALGDPFYGTVPCLWGFGWNGSGFGVFVSHDWWTASPTWQGPFNGVMPTGGFAGRMDAHLALPGEKKRPGLLAAAIRTRGLATARMQLG